MFRERTVYLIVCDSRDCGTVYEFYDYDADETFELRIDTPSLDTWRQSMVEDGWSVGTRVLCPPCTSARDNTVLERMAVDLTQDPLWADGDPAEDEVECWWRAARPGRRVETVPISIDDWPLEV